MVNYRKPTSFSIRETFPLPPYSTVIGMVHNLCGFTEYHPMKVGVQGTCRGIASDLFTRYSFSNRPYKDDRHWMKVPDGDNSIGLYRGLAHTELLCNVELILHIEPEQNDFNTVWNGLNNPLVYPSLGRHEDLIDLEEIKIVDLHQADEVQTLRDIYIPLDLLKDPDNANMDGTIYSLSKEYEIDKKSGIRRWKNRIESRCLGAENLLYNFMADNDLNPVALV